MSLVSNAQNVAFTTRWPSDKIVGVWEGSFNRATDVTTVTGDFGSIYVYRIAHGLTRPVATDLLWKATAGWTDGGCTDNFGDISISYSDSTYIYVVSSAFAPAVGTMTYKVIGSWIPDYDNTNPLVSSYVSSNKTKVFDTSINYQKVYLQNALSYTSPSTQSVTHSLGYRPNFRVFYEAFNGQVWPCYSGGTANPFLYDSSMVECIASVTTTSLSVELLSVTGTKRAWYKVYLDA
jgi:hypothetical protein